MVEAHSLRNLDRGQNVAEYAIGIEAFQFGFGTKHEAMTQSGQGGGFHVVRDHVVAIVERGQSLRDQHQADGGARTGAQRDRRPTPGAARDFADVAQQRMVPASVRATRDVPAADASPSRLAISTCVESTSADGPLCFSRIVISSSAEG